MPKYLAIGHYNEDSVKGLLSAGARSRLEAITAMVSGLGGSIDSMFWGQGGADVYAIATLPNDAAAQAVALAGSTAGTVTVVRVLDADEVDEAIGLAPNFRRPGE